jgi:hypothetical protein
MNQVEHRRCNDNKKEFLTYAINNNKTIAFEYTTRFYVLSPMRICNFGKSVLMYNEIIDTFDTFIIDEMTFYPIPEDLRADTEEVAEEVSNEEVSNEEVSNEEVSNEEVSDEEVSDDVLSLQSEYESESDESEDDLDISLLTELYDW